MGQGKQHCFIGKKVFPLADSINVIEMSFQHILPTRDISVDQVKGL